MKTASSSSKDWAANLWKRVEDEQADIDRRYETRKMELIQLHEEEKRKNHAAKFEETKSDRKVTEQDIQKIMEGATSPEDFDCFAPHRFSVSDANVHPDYRSSDETMPSILQVTRAEIENDSDIRDLRMAAMAADEYVEDAAGALLNVMSKNDTTMRSARVAAETCLLSECNAAHRCLRSLVALERSSINDRIKRLQVLEAAVDAIDVRKDIDIYITHDKTCPGGSSRLGNDDDGGIAAALAVLNSHGGGASERSPLHIKRPSYFEGWSENEDEDANKDDGDDLDLCGDVIKMLFGHKKEASNINEDTIISILTPVLEQKSKRGHALRNAVLYELNNQRSIKTQVEKRSDFKGLCDIFYAFLSGCGREPLDVSNAKLLMILSQTFFFVEQEDSDTKSNEDSNRKGRVYVKHEIQSHPIWSEDDFW